MCQEQGPVLRIVKDTELKKAAFAFPPMNSKIMSNQIEKYKIPYIYRQLLAPYSSFNNI